MVRSALTVQEKAETWRAYRAGASLRSISRTLGRTMEALRTLVAATGGRIPLVPRRSARWLALAEREEISRGIVAGHACRLIGGRIRRAGSTVSLERSPGTGVAAATARARPGRQPWAGDLLLGRANSAIATLVERTSRVTVRVRLPEGPKFGARAHGAGRMLRE